MTDSASLYERILGPKWQDLDITVQNFLRQPCEVLQLSAEGLPQPHTCRATLKIGNGDWWLSRIVARMLKLPRVGSDVGVRVIRQIEHHREIWTRQFPDVVLKSEQWQENARLIEKMGCVVCEFELRVAQGSLMFHHQSTSLQVFGARWRLPGIIAPTLTGYCDPGRDAASTVVHVSLWLPVARVVLSYSGVVA